MKELTEKTQTVILAGGTGERLRPLTEFRAKPAVSFGGKYRIIDFTLSNCFHSKLRKIYVLPQYEPVSLQKHLNSWSRIFSSEMGEYLEVLNPRSQIGHDLAPYTGTADAVFQNIKYLMSEKPEYILILYGDQIYKMDYREIINFHCEKEADLTIAIVESNEEVARRSGVIETDKNQKVIGFEEKPEKPKSLPDNPERFFVSMAVCVFNASLLIKELEKDYQDNGGSHDFGRNIIPRMFREGKKIFALPLIDHKTGSAGYWRDLGTIGSYYEANMDLCSIKPKFNLHDENWFWRTPVIRQLPPAKTVFRSEVKGSIICEGCIIDDAGIYHSIIAPNVRIGRNVIISNSIIMRGVEIGDNVRISRAIIDKGNKISSGSIIGVGCEGCKDKEIDGIVVIPHHEESLNED